MSSRLRSAELYRLCCDLGDKVARYLADHDDLGEAQRHALGQRHAVRGHYSLHIAATPAIHRAMLQAALSLYAERASSASRKAYRIYWERLNNATISSQKD